MTDKTIQDARDQIATDMKAVIADTEELLRATAGATGERLATVRARVEDRLRTARENLAHLHDPMLDQAKEAARSADEYVREHPWGAVGVAAAAGLLIGVLISRR